MKTFRDVIVVAGLEGSLGGIRRLIQELPPAFPASVLVILQEPVQALELGSNLAADGSLPFLRAQEGQRIRKGHVYLGSSYAGIVVRPWGELGLEPALAHDSRHIGMRRCFNSVASVWGNRVIGILMGPRSEKAVDSLAIIASSGGIAIVQTTSGTIPSPTSDPPIDASGPHRNVRMEDMAALLMVLIGVPAPAASSRFSRQIRHRTPHDC